MVSGSVNSNVTVNDIYPPVITIILPQAISYSISTLAFNVSLDEDGSMVWFTLNSGVTNYTLSSTNNRNFNYTITLADATYTARFYANDTGNRIGNKNVTFVIDTSILGGGPGTSIGIIIPTTETEPYNKTFLCNKASHFINLHTFNNTLNYTEEEFNYFKNNLVIELGVGISNRVLRAFIENFEGNCPDYGVVPGGEDVIPVPGEKKNKYLGLWILFSILVVSLAVALIINRKYVLALLLINRRKNKDKI